MELGLAFELRSWLHNLNKRHCVDMADLRWLMTSSLPSHFRFGFRDASASEMHCCFRSACQLVKFCCQERLDSTAQYLKPIVSLAFIEKIERRSILEEDTELVFNRRSKEFMRLRNSKELNYKILPCF